MARSHTTNNRTGSFSSAQPVAGRGLSTSSPPGRKEPPEGSVSSCQVRHGPTLGLGPWAEVESCPWQEQRPPSGVEHTVDAL